MDVNSEIQCWPDHFSCKVCNICFIPLSETVDSHLQTFGHRFLKELRVKNYRPWFTVQTATGICRADVFKFLDSAGTLLCQICNIVLRGSLMMFEHQRSEQHITLLKDRNIYVPIVYYCEDCSVFNFGDFQWNIHFQSGEHRRAAALSWQMKASRPAISAEADSYYGTTNSDSNVMSVSSSNFQSSTIAQDSNMLANSLNLAENETTNLYCSNFQPSSFGENKDIGQIDLTTPTSSTNEIPEPINSLNSVEETLPFDLLQILNKDKLISLIAMMKAKNKVPVNLENQAIFSSPLSLTAENSEFSDHFATGLLSVSEKSHLTAAFIVNDFAVKQKNTALNSLKYVLEVYLEKEKAHLQQDFQNLMELAQFKRKIELPNEDIIGPPLKTVVRITENIRNNLSSRDQFTTPLPFTKSLCNDLVVAFGSSNVISAANLNMDLQTSTASNSDFQCNVDNADDLVSRTVLKLKSLIDAQKLQQTPVSDNQQCSSPRSQENSSSTSRQSSQYRSVSRDRSRSRSRSHSPHYYRHLHHGRDTRSKRIRRHPDS